MRFYSALISSFLLASAVLAQDNEWIGGGVTLISENIGTFRTIEGGMKTKRLTGAINDSVTAFVSLDATGCPDSVFVGMTCTVTAVVSKPSDTECKAWLSAKPGLRMEITTFPIDVGDTVFFGATAPHLYTADPSGAHGVSVFFEKINSSVHYEEIFEDYKPCGQQAGWAVANTPDPALPGHYLPIAHFGRLEFSFSMTYDPNGIMYGPTDGMAHPYNMASSNGTFIATLEAEGNTIVATDIRSAGPN